MVEQNENILKPNGSTLKEMSKPHNLFGYTLALISIILAYYFYEKGIQKRDLVYTTIGDVSKIYDSQAGSSGIMVIASDSTRIGDDVYLKTVAVWNNGNLPINPEDVRSPIILNLQDANRVLQAKIIGQSDTTISKFMLIKQSALSSSKSNNELELKWKYFDPKSWVKIQYVYTGSATSKLIIGGKILGMDNVRLYDPNGKKELILDYISNLIFTFTPIVLAFGFLSFAGPKLNNKSNTIKIWVLVLTFAFVIGVYIYMVMFSSGMKIFAPSLPF